LSCINLPASSAAGGHPKLLYAQAAGLASRSLVGNQMLLNRDKPLRKKQGLSKHERIFGTLCLGFPAVKFRNKVMGKKIPIQWNEG
jgi:hypothetical protein